MFKIHMSSMRRKNSIVQLTSLPSRKANLPVQNHNWLCQGAR